MRKPVTIDVSKAGGLRNRLIQRLQWLDVNQSWFKGDKVFMGTMKARAVVKFVIEEEVKACAELGNGFTPDAVGVAYLSTFL